MKQDNEVNQISNDFGTCKSNMTHKLPYMIYMRIDSKRPFWLYFDN